MRISSAELVRNFGKYSDLALNEPVVVTKNGRDRLVLLGIAEYEFLREMIESENSRTEKSEPSKTARRGRTGKKIAG
jgi:prevent-host-death family protein